MQLADEIANSDKWMSRIQETLEFRCLSAPGPAAAPLFPSPENRRKKTVGKLRKETAPMTILDMLSQSGGVDALAKELGIDPGLAHTAANALLPAVVGGFKKTSQAHPDGLDGLAGILGGFGGSGLLENVIGAQPTQVSVGNAILGQIFGSKDVSRTVAAGAAQSSGLDPALLKKALPILAMLVAGYLSKQGGVAAPSGGGVLGGLLGQVIGGALGGGHSSAQPSGGLGGLASMLDFNHDGNPLDDILGMAGKLSGH
jgi:hypothetical protein